MSHDFFEVLGVAPALGRLFHTNLDGVSGHDPTVVLSYGFWVDGFGRSENILTQTLMLDGRSHSIVGVAPQDFEDPFGSSPIASIRGDDIYAVHDT